MRTITPQLFELNYNAMINNAANVPSRTLVKYCADMERSGIADAWIDITADVVNGTVAISQSSEIPQYASISHMPQAATLNFNVYDRKGEFSPDNDLPEIRKGTLIEVGYAYDFFDARVTTDTSLRRNETLTTPTTLFFAMVENGVVFPREIATGDAGNKFTDLFSPRYDSLKYDSANYTRNSFVTYAREFASNEKRIVQKIVITTQGVGYSGRSYARAYARPINDNDDNPTLSSTDWISLGAITSDVATFYPTEFAEKFYRGVEVAIVFDSNWRQFNTVGLEPYVASVELTTYTSTLYLVGNRFYVDDVVGVEPKDPEINYVEITARDAWAKMIETNTVFNKFKSLQTTYPIVAVVAAVESATGMILSDGGTAGLLAPYPYRDSQKSFIDEPTPCEQILDYVAQIVGFPYWLPPNTTIPHVIFYTLTNDAGNTMRDYIVARNDDMRTPVFTMDFSRYDTIVKQKRVDRFLKRAIFATSDESVSDEAILTDLKGDAFARWDTSQRPMVVASDGELLLDENGLFTVNWVQDLGEATQWYAVMRSIALSRTLNDGEKIEMLSLGHGTAQFRTTGIDTTKRLTFSMRGHFWEGDIPTAYGEWWSVDNMIAGVGIDTGVVINPILADDDEAYQVAQNHIDYYSNAKYHLEITYPFRVAHLDIFDRVTVHSKLSPTDTRNYRIIGIEQRGGLTDASTTYTLIDMEDL